MAAGAGPAAADRRPRTARAVVDQRARAGVTERDDGALKLARDRAADRADLVIPERAPLARLRLLQGAGDVLVEPFDCHQQLHDLLHVRRVQAPRVAQDRASEHAHVRLAGREVGGVVGEFVLRVAVGQLWHGSSG